MRLAIVLGLFTIMSVALGADEVPVAPPPHYPLAVDELTKGLMTALGDDFEFLGAEAGRTKAVVGTWAAERFWFAKVRPKKAGQFALGYTIRFDFELNPLQKPNWSSSGTYLVPLAIAEKGAPRLMSTTGYAAPAYPLATVGDTIIIPIHVDRFRTQHAFFKPDAKHPQMRAFFNVAGESVHDQYLKSKAEEPVVRNDVPDHVKLLATWGNSITNRPGTLTHHTLLAYLEFSGPGNINLAGRLAEAAEKTAGDGIAYRILAKDQPITVGVEYFNYSETGGGATSHGGGYVNFGTRAVRVGDRVLLSLGGANSPGPTAARDFRPGVVFVRPFQPVASYTPEPTKGPEAGHTSTRPQVR